MPPVASQPVFGPVSLPGELAAIGAAMARLEPGDPLLGQVDRVEEALAFVQAMLKQAGIDAGSR